MKIRYTQTALSELDDILAYLAHDSEQAALRLADRIDGAISRLSFAPESAPLTSERGVRQLTIRRSPYLVFYTLRESEVVILHIRHGARLRPWELED